MKTSKIALPLILSMVLVAGAGSVLRKIRTPRNLIRVMFPAPDFRAAFMAFTMA